MAPSRNDHHVALRCAAGVFVPLTALLLLGRVDVAVFASFGAFTGIYGRNEPHARRFVIQLLAGLLMILVLLLAALTARAGEAFTLSAADTTWLQVLATTWWPADVR